MAPPTTPSSGEIFSVSRLNREVRDLLDHGLPTLWVQGELSNFHHHGSGHMYFSLKDAGAQVSCAMFRQRNRALGFAPDNGALVLVRARASLYEPRGNYQLIVEHMEEAGDGALRQAWEELRRRLDAEGLFEAAGKRELPALPTRIGVITSPTGAAIRDVLSVLQRRFPAIPVLVYPVPVQGEGAGAKIADMIRHADQRADCDVLILARGGGSLEDLWAFNEEVVARAIHDCGTPLVSGVGHETDVTIADFVADARAATPSAAAELVSPDQSEWLERLRNRQDRLENRMLDALTDRKRRLDWVQRRLQQQHPGSRLRNQMQRLDELDQRMRLAWRGVTTIRRARLSTARARLQQHNPVQRLRALSALHGQLQGRLRRGMDARLTRARGTLTAVSRALDTVSPLATLGRGYAIVSTAAEGRVLRNAGEVDQGDLVDARLATGRLRCRVEEQLDD